MVKKIAGGTLGLGATISLVLAYVDQKTSAIEKSIDEKNVAVYRYVDVKHQEIKSGLDRMNDTLDRIDNRVFNLYQTVNRGKE